ncbi:MAG: RHS repeat-associated core domain-containing protein, partial [Phycisphaerales bacterium]
SVCPGARIWYDTDMIGTTRFMTDSIGDDVDSAVYTAFGERVSGTQHHFGYVGAWGYQTHDDLPFLHVGHRYYDPATGRFLQHDPIGIRGGLNVYAYVRNGPTIRIDPDGLFVVGACVGYCGGRLGGCVAGAGGKPAKIAKCEAKYKACEICCGNADIESQMGDDKGPPPYGPPPATFDPWPAGGWRWRAIAILLLCFVSLWAKRVQPVPRVSK